MISSREDIIKYIPQREPMVLVHSLLEHSDKLTISGFDIEEQHVFVSNGCLTEAGLLENMAQTAALSKGYEYAQKNEKPPIGFIGAVKNFVVHQLPAIGKQLKTHLIVKHEVLNASIVHVSVSCDEEEIASCELKIFINPEIQAI
jgi:predicted hotdog family 3-hydroxylacyl-ACP dehydratase